MAVYVDDARIPCRGWKMSHLVADTLAELHEMAAKLYLRESWFQVSNLGTPHYDIAEIVRKQAISYGAKVLDCRGMVDFIKRYRAENGPHSVPIHTEALPIDTGNQGAKE